MKSFALIAGALLSLWITGFAWAELNLEDTALENNEQIQLADPNVAITQQGKINLNTADAKTISDAIKGIGKKRARSIINYREEHGPFATVEDLSNVKGISSRFVKHRLAELQEKFTV